MTTHKRIDVAELSDLLAACWQVATLGDKELSFRARMARNQLRQALDDMTGVIDEPTDWAD